MTINIDNQNNTTQLEINNNKHNEPTSHRLGGCINLYSSIFNYDNTVLFVCCSNTIRLYSVKTGETVGLLSGHTDEITSLHTSHNNNEHIYSTSLDGTIRCWNYITAQCVIVYHIKSPIIHAQLINSTFYLNVNNKLYNNANNEPFYQISKYCKVYTYNMAKAQQTQSQHNNINKQQQHKSDNKQSSNTDNTSTDDTTTQHITAQSPAYTFRYNSQQCRAISVHPTGQYIASTSKNLLLLHNLRNNQTIAIQHVRLLSTVTFHPTEHYIATGDDEGQIILWYNYDKLLDNNNVNNNSKSVNNIRIIDGRSCTVRSCHWHSHIVWCLTFSTDGAYMLSGGEEGVLVLWQLLTGHKHYIPRLGSSICYITQTNDSNIYAVTLANNSICLINGITSRVQSYIYSLTYSSKITYTPPLPIHIRRLYDKQYNNDDVLLYSGIQWYRKDRQWIMLNGSNGCIQLYDIYNNKLINNIQITNYRNVISRIDDTLNTIKTNITHIKTNNTGDRLVTIERRSDSTNVISSNTIIKYWHWLVNNDNNIQSSGEWILNTQVIQPHNNYNIIDISYNPIYNVCITIGNDNIFKLWVEQTNNIIPNISLIHNKPSKSQQHITSPSSSTSSSWQCISTNTYRNNLNVTCVQWSADGSLLAIVYNHIITLWSYNHNNKTLQLISTIVHNNIHEPIIHISFSNITTSPYIVCYSKYMLYVWNLCTLQCIYQKSITIAALTVADNNDIFAIVRIIQHKRIETEDKQQNNENNQHHNKSKITTTAATDNTTTYSTKLELYNFTSSEPIVSYDIQSIHRVKNQRVNTYITNLLFVPSTNDNNDDTSTSLSLLYIDQQHNIIRIDNILSGSNIQQYIQPSYSMISSSSNKQSIIDSKNKSDFIISSPNQQPISFIKRLYGHTVSPKIQSINNIHNNIQSSPLFKSTIVSSNQFNQQLDTIINISNNNILPSADDIFQTLLSVNNDDNNNTNNNNNDTVMNDNNIEQFILDNHTVNHTDNTTIDNKSISIQANDDSTTVTTTNIFDDIASHNKKLLKTNPFEELDFTNIFAQQQQQKSTDNVNTDDTITSTTSHNKHKTPKKRKNTKTVTDNKTVTTNGIHNDSIITEQPHNTLNHSQSTGVADDTSQQLQQQQLNGIKYNDYVDKVDNNDNDNDNDTVTVHTTAKKSKRYKVVPQTSVKQNNNNNTIVNGTSTSDTNGHTTSKTSKSSNRRKTRS